MTKVYIKNKEHPWYGKIGNKLADKPYPFTGTPGVLIELECGTKCMAKPDDIQEMIQ